MATQAERLVWELMLDADMNARYWAYLANKYQTYDQWAKIFLAATGTVTIGAWAVQHQIFGGILSLVSASLFVFIYNLPKTVERMATLRGKWIELHFVFRRLWAKSERLDDDEIDTVLAELQSKVVSANQAEAGLPIDKALIDKCWTEVVAAVGRQ
jgi:hypothetical protein